MRYHESPNLEYAISLWKRRGFEPAVNSSKYNEQLHVLSMPVSGELVDSAESDINQASDSFVYVWTYEPARRNT